MPPSLRAAALALALASGAFAQLQWADKAAASNMTAGIFAYDEAREVIVSVGAETWEYGGQNWVLRSLGAQPRAISDLTYCPYPAGVHAVGSLFDPADQRLELYVAHLAGSSAWKDLPASNIACGRAVAACYDHARRELVVLTAASEAPQAPLTTWLNSLAPQGAWRNANATGPTPRDTLALAYDRARERVVLFGGRAGNTYLDDTWEWDGTSWTQRMPTARPSPRAPQRMFFDETHARIFLFGGEAANAQSLADLWEYDGTTWRKPAISATPSPAAGAVVSIAPHTATGRIVCTTDEQGHRRSWTLSNPALAELEPFGTDCGTLLNPRRTERPWIGAGLEIRASHWPTDDPAVLMLGGSKTAWGSLVLPFDLNQIGVPFCWLYVAPDLFLPMQRLPPNGPSAVTIAIPDAPGLVGAQLHVQVLRFLRVSGISLSQAATLTVGRRW